MQYQHALSCPNFKIHGTKICNKGQLRIKLHSSSTQIRIRCSRSAKTISFHNKYIHNNSIYENTIKDENKTRNVRKKDINKSILESRKNPEQFYKRSLGYEMTNR